MHRPGGMKAKLCGAFLVLALALGQWLGLFPAEAATSTTIQPSTDDSWLGGGSLAVDTNNNTGVSGLYLNITNRGPTNRSVVRFNLSTIPSDAYAKTGTLSLFVVTAPGSRFYNAHQITASWLEGEVTWNSRLTGTPWTTPGGDFNATVTY